MHLPSSNIIAFVFLVFALALLPEKYRPRWIQRLSWWQVFIGLIAMVLVFLIVLNPELGALGLLGDSAFLDLMALAIGIQLQVILSSIGINLATAGSKIFQFARWRYAVVSTVLAVAAYDMASTVLRVAHRFTSLLYNV